MNSQTTLSYEVSSELAGVAVQEVWEQINTWAGVNYELGPWVRMTHPDQIQRVTDVAPDGAVHFSSRILALGLLPIDTHHFGLRDIKPPEFFDEASYSGMMQVWCHRRTLTPTQHGVRVTDQCHFTPRFALLGGLLRWVYLQIFRRRHRRLTKFFANR